MLNIQTVSAKKVQIPRFTPLCMFSTTIIGAAYNQPHEPQFPYVKNEDKGMSF